MHLLADFILKYPKTILVSIIVLTIGAVFPASQIDTDFNLEGFFPKDASTIEEYNLLADEFGRDDNVIAIAFEAENILTPDVLSDIKQLTDAFENIPNTIETISIWTATRIQVVNGTLITEPFLTDEVLFESQTDEYWSALRTNFSEDPFIGNLLINNAATVNAIFISIDDDLNSYLVRDEIIAQIRTILAEFDHKYEFRLAGIPYFRNQYVHMLNDEILMYISISSIFILMLLWWLFRSVRGVLIPISIVWLTILFTVAVIVLTGGYFEILSSTIAPILLCVGVADSIHLLVKYQDSRLLGHTPGTSLRETIIVLGSATLLTSVTTAIGFGTLVTSNVIPMQRFGVYTAIGVLIAFVITIFLLPTILPYFKDGVKGEKAQIRTHQYLGILLNRSYKWVLSHHKFIVIATLLVTVVFAFGATNIKVNGKIFDDVGKSTQVMKDSQFFTENLAPQFPLEIIVNTGEESGAFDPELLQRIDNFDVFLTKYPEIERTTSIATLVREIHKVMSPDEFALNPLPAERDLIAQYMFLLELTGTDAISKLVDFDYQTIRITANIEDVGSYRMNQIRDDLNIHISRYFPNETVTITGTSILVADLTGNIVGSLASSIALAFVFISLIMGWLFRNGKLVLISILPNIIPLVIAAGTMGFLGIDLKPSTAVIFTIAFGIAVDDSIHYLARLRIELARLGSLSKAIAITTEKTGRAIILTSVILITGFGTLATSAFTSTMLMGALTCLTVITAVIADLFFLPALLHWMKPDIKLQAKT